VRFAPAHRRLHSSTRPAPGALGVCPAEAPSRFPRGRKRLAASARGVCPAEAPSRFPRGRKRLAASARCGLSEPATCHGEEPRGLAARALGRERGGGPAGRPGGVDGCGRVRVGRCGRVARAGACGAGPKPGYVQHSARVQRGQRAGHADGACFPGRASPAEPPDHWPLVTYNPRCGRPGSTRARSALVPSSRREE